LTRIFYNGFQLSKGRFPADKDTSLSLRNALVKIEHRTISFGMSISSKFQPDASVIELLLFHKPRGCKGVWLPVDDDSAIRVTKGKGKWMKLIVKSNTEIFFRDNVDVFLLDTSDLNGQTTFGQDQRELLMAEKLSHSQKEGITIVTITQTFPEKLMGSPKSEDIEKVPIESRNSFIGKTKTICSDGYYRDTRKRESSNFTIKENRSSDGNKNGNTPLRQNLRSEERRGEKSFIGHDEDWHCSNSISKVNGMEGENTILSQVEFELKLDRVCNQLRFFVLVSTERGIFLGKSVEFSAHNNGKVRKNKSMKEFKLSENSFQQFSMEKRLRTEEIISDLSDQNLHQEESHSLTETENDPRREDAKYSNTFSATEQEQQNSPISPAKSPNLLTSNEEPSNSKSDLYKDQQLNFHDCHHHHHLGSICEQLQDTAGSGICDTGDEAALVLNFMRRSVTEQSFFSRELDSEMKQKSIERSRSLTIPISRTTSELKSSNKSLKSFEKGTSFPKRKISIMDERYENQMKSSRFQPAMKKPKQEKEQQHQQQHLHKELQFPLQFPLKFPLQSKGTPNTPIKLNTADFNNSTQCNSFGEGNRMTGEKRERFSNHDRDYNGSSFHDSFLHVHSDSASAVSKNSNSFSLLPPLSSMTSAFSPPTSLVFISGLPSTCSNAAQLRKSLEEVWIASLSQSPSLSLSYKRSSHSDRKPLYSGNPILEIQLFMNPFFGKSTGCGWIQFANREVASKMIQLLHRRPFLGSDEVFLSLRDDQSLPLHSVSERHIGLCDKMGISLSPLRVQFPSIGIGSKQINPPLFPEENRFPDLNHSPKLKSNSSVLHHSEQHLQLRNSSSIVENSRISPFGSISSLTQLSEYQLQSELQKRIDLQNENKAEARAEVEVKQLRENIFRASTMDLSMSPFSLPLAFASSTSSSSSPLPHQSPIICIDPNPSESRTSA